MPELDVDFALEATKQLIRLEKDWVPSCAGDFPLHPPEHDRLSKPALGVQLSKKFLFYIMLGPVGAYYPQGFNPVDIYVGEKYIRAARGGLGEAKTLANYAASFLAQEEAHEDGLPRCSGSTPLSGNTWKKWAPVISSFILVMS